MTRKYKKNRSRGTRKSTYNEYTFGGFTLPKKGKMTDKDYLELAYETNKESMERFYRSQMKAMQRNPEELTAFTERFPSSKELFTTKIKGYVQSKGLTVLKATRYAIEQEFGEVQDRLERNFVQGLKTCGLWNQLVSLLKPEVFNFKQLRYTGNSVYTYFKKDGGKISWMVSTSPMQLILVE